MGEYGGTRALEGRGLEGLRCGWRCDPRGPIYRLWVGLGWRTGGGDLNESEMNSRESRDIK